MAKEDIGKLIDEETKRRLEIMQQDNYVFPEKAGRKDLIAILVLIVICMVLISGCMMGVIV